MRGSYDCWFTIVLLTAEQTIESLLEFLVSLIVKLFNSAKKTRLMNGSLMTGLFGDPVKRKGVVADKVGKEKDELWIEYFSLKCF